MTKQNWNYTSKNESRKMFRNFILSHKKDLDVDLKDAKVLCLPGYDEAAGTSLEIEQVYDKIGIKRRNIVGLEEDKKNYKCLEAANLGIELKHLSDTEYLWKNEEKFDILCLDYCGTLKDSVAWSLIYAYIKGLKNKCIIHTNFLAKRDHRSEIFYDEVSNIGLKLLPIVSKDDPGYICSELTDQYSEEIENELNQKRSDGITKYLINLARDYPILAKGLPSVFVMDKEFKESDFSPEGWQSGIWWKYHERLINELKPQYDALAAQIIVSHLMNREIEPFFCESLERYEYQNPNGTRMYGDMFFFERHPEWYDEKKHPISMRANKSGNREIIIGNATKQGYTSLKIDELGYRDIIIDNNNKENILEKKCIKHALFVNEVSCTKRKNMPKRVVLGTIEDPKIKSSCTFNELIRNELLSGTPEIELYEKYPKLNPRKVAAIKAHITMGTYENQ